MYVLIGLGCFFFPFSFQSFDILAPFDCARLKSYGILTVTLLSIKFSFRSISTKVKKNAAPVIYASDNVQIDDLEDNNRKPKSSGFDGKFAHHSKKKNNKKQTNKHTNKKKTHKKPSLLTVSKTLSDQCRCCNNNTNIMCSSYNYIAPFLAEASSKRFTYYHPWQTCYRLNK